MTTHTQDFEMELVRIAKQNTYTIGHLYLEKERNKAGHPVFGKLCDTLEPRWRDYAHGKRKVKGKSAIPEGRYRVELAPSEKFRRWLPALLFVPQFRGIRIHAGNTADDTEGCILVGVNTAKGEVRESQKWLDELMRQLWARRNAGQRLWLTVK